MKRGIVIMVMGALCLGSVFKLKQLMAKRFISIHYHIIVDELLADDVAQQIKTFGQKIGHQELPYRELCAALQNRFPMIKSVALARINPQLTKISVAAGKPIIIINQDHVLTDSGTIFNKKVFNPYLIAELESIHMHSGCACGKSCVDFILSVPPHFFKNFTVIWFDQHTILLLPKHDPLVAVRITADTVINQIPLQRIETIKKELGQTKKGIIADVRFDKQIVIQQVPESVLNELLVIPEIRGENG